MKSSKLKVTVYAISKNEEKFVDRWVDSMREADEIVVLDTGSTDLTVEKLRKRGVRVVSKVITPWRFDTARNESLKLVSPDTDVCVCTDLDEVFTQNWRKHVEESWLEGTKLLKYKYVWNTLENGEDGITFWYEKIHARENFSWVYPVHEILRPKQDLLPSEISVCTSITLRHHPDHEKSRSQYLNLLELSVKEDPTSDRNTHYLAREYMFAGRLNDAIKTFKKHLKLKTATWREERSASLRYIGDCYVRQNKIALAETYYKKAIIESFDTREGYLNLAQLYYNRLDYLSCAFVLESMLKITDRRLSYITNPNCWNDYPFDMLSYCYYKLGQVGKARTYALNALQINPNNNRVKNNLRFYLSLS